MIFWGKYIVLIVNLSFYCMVKIKQNKTFIAIGYVNIMVNWNFRLQKKLRRLCRSIRFKN